MLNSYGHFIYLFFLLFLVFNNIFKYQLLRAFDHICMEKARYKFLIIIIIIIIIIIGYNRTVGFDPSRVSSAVV